MSLLNWPWHHPRTAAPGRSLSKRAAGPKAARPAVEALETRLAPSVAAAPHLLAVGHAGHHARRAISFTGTLTTTPAGPVVQDPSNPFATSQLRSFTGTFGALGPVTGTVTETTTFDPATGALTFVDSFTLTFRGGTVRGVGQGTLTPDASHPNTLDLEETDTFTGGTGRFAGVTGEARASSQIDMTTGVEVGSILGVLNMHRG